MSRTKRVIGGAALVLVSLLLLGSGGAVKSADAWSGPPVVAVGADVHTIMATGACKPGAAVGG